MLYLYFGTDIEKARAAARARAGERALRITDAHTVEDLGAALLGGGMFGAEQTVILDRIFANGAMHEIIFAKLSTLRDSRDSFHLVTEKLDVTSQKMIEKHASEVQKFEMAKGSREVSTVFALANALKRGDKKILWVALQREFLNDAAPEALHGMLFWAAKDMFLKSRLGSTDRARAAKLVAQLAELPHEARRRGEELSYALERFTLA
jgi:hypothetical protein